MATEVTGGWRKVHNEELHNFYASPNIIRVVKSIKEDDMGRALSTHEEVINAYKISVGKPEEKTPLGRPSHRW
jgi:hypothetical protein